VFLCDILCIFVSLLHYQISWCLKYFIVCMYVMFNFRPVTPASQSKTPSHQVSNLPCRDISNRENSSSASSSRRAVCNANDVKQDGVIEKDSSASVQSVGHTEVEKKRARRSLHYDNNDNIIDDELTEYVLSRKRPSSPGTEQPRKRCRSELEVCTLESLGDDVSEARGTESERRTPTRLSRMTIGRRSGLWKVSTPSREQTVTPRKDRMTQLDTPSKSVTFHDSVVGGESDDASAAETQSRTGTPRSGRTQKTSLTQTCQSPVQASPSSGKGTPRARRSTCLTPKSSQKRTPSKSAEAPSSSAGGTPRRLSARVANLSSQLDSGHSRANKATPRSEGKKQKDLPVRRLLSAASPGTGRVLRPRTPRSCKFREVDDDDNNDLYKPDAESSSAEEESSDEEKLAEKKTAGRKATKEVINFC